MRRAGYLAAVALGLAACTTSPAVSPERRESALEAGQADVVYAASSVVRVLRNGSVIGRIDLRRTVTQIAFEPSGERAFVATSDGVHLVDGKTHRDLRRITTNPARSVVVSAASGKLWVLENSVRRLADGHNEALGFHLVRLDLGRLTREADVEVGERMLAVGIGASPSAPVLMVAESGSLATLRFPSGAAAPLAAARSLGGRVRIGPVLDHDGKTIYLPVEGPEARILAVDLERQSVEAIPLGRDAYLRALALSPDGEVLYVNALNRVAAVDLASSGRTVRWGPDLPGPSQSLAVSPDGARLYLARPVDGNGGGAVVTVDAATLEHVSSTSLTDISPFTVAVRP